MPGGDEIVLWLLLAISTFTDLKWGKVYNVVTFPMMGAGIVYRLAVGGTPTPVDAIAAIAVAFLLFFPLYLLKVFAAGDVKLLMAIGAWTSTPFIMNLGAAAIVIGAGVGGYLLFTHRGARNSFKSLFQHLRIRTGKENLLSSSRMPFAPAFLCAYMLMHISKSYQWGIF